MNAIPEILAYKRETKNKIRWDANVDGTIFELYIPKWRIPDPAPERILIRIFLTDDNIETKDQYTPDEIKQDPELRNQPIYSELTRISEHTKTIRFDPIGNPNPNNREIGSPYIPKSILYREDIKRLYIVVEWK
jgi:hypothetical protein